MSTSSGDWTTLVPVTGEAVALDLRIAQFPSRTLGLALDLAVQFGALLLMLWLASSIASEVDVAAASAITLVAVVAVIVGLPTLIETLTRGRSLGKLATGLRVVRDDGGPVRFRHSFVRALFMIVDFWISGGSVGLISSLASSKGKRLGDHFAGTVVVRGRVPSRVRIDQGFYAMPPGLEAWAASLDLARLPDVSALQARQLLARGSAMDPAVRATMGAQLAAEFSSYVAPPPPAGTPAETYLTAVLTERLRRASRTPAGSTANRRPAAPPRSSTPVPTGWAPPPAPSEPPRGDDGPFALPR
ncbi:MAG TPA: RDD family protein [Candidatus Nanopelagicales bacterium]|nr:RDD family protein [Candidatus Nanopelagicales bacterium]